jgi:hypothetical protein
MRAKYRSSSHRASYPADRLVDITTALVIPRFTTTPTCTGFGVSIRRKELASGTDAGRTIQGLSLFIRLLRHAVSIPCRSLVPGQGFADCA